jgi:hypothetical protein
MKIFTFPLKDFTSPRDLCTKMKGVKFYTYTFYTQTDIIKEGKAADTEWMSGTWGNRIYRQAGGIKGWTIELNDSSANKMREQMQKYFPDVTKDHVSITVYDYTDELEGESNSEIDRVLLNKEDERVRAYINEHGVPPKLNIQATKTRTKPILNNNLFEEE